jgi:group II intron reverse transcriptase/maturase
MEVREMRDAETVLGIIRERGKEGLPLEQVYRQLYNPNLYLRAYGKIGRNQGATTPGVTSETADGMSMATIDTIIDLISHERYRWSPARRIHIPKKNGKMRPLGLPTWSDKLVQEVMRSILDAYYEPRFSDRSHGFRPQRGCHTALQNISKYWTGVRWFIEGDISQFFDKLDHQILLSILGEQIHDNRFLRLIANLLEAGYMEDWRFNKTLSGAPQGGVVSPILSNIYLDKLDKFVETELLPTYNRGTRGVNLEYNRLAYHRWKLRKDGHREEAERVLRHMQSIPSRDTHADNHRRLRYVRYADDFLLGFNGPRAEAEVIKEAIGTFLRTTLRLEMAEEKTLITHALTGRARFLGYELGVFTENTRHDHSGRRSINGRIRMSMPVDVVKEKCAAYMQQGKPIQRAELLANEPYSTVVQYQAEFRGISEYYAYAHNRASRLSRLMWIMQESLVKTLANKFKVRQPAIYKRYHRTIITSDGPRSVLEVRVQREGKPDLVAQWGGLSTKRRDFGELDDNPKRVWSDRSELVQRLLANACELCDSQDNVEVHHIRALKDLRQKGRTELPTWVQRMIARKRKTLVLCRTCHMDVQHGRPGLQRTYNAGEPGAVKVASPVCAARRFVASLMQLGGTWRSVPGSPGLPERESARGQEHAREAVVVWRRPGRRAARPA